MKMKQLPIALVALGLAASIAQAQTVDRRHGDQAGRIEQGVASGRLTPHEAGRVERQQASIDAQEARMRTRDGGHLTGYDRTRLQHRENNASRHIYHAKHNRRGY
jgi:hypothetical protein